MDCAIYLDPYFVEIDKCGLDLKNYPLDHIGFSATSKEQYEERKEEFLSIGELVREHIVSGRRVAVFRLNNKLVYRNYEVFALELVEPKSDEINPVDGFEHAEFTIDVPFETFVSQYPQIGWDTSSMNRPDFPRVKFVFENGTEIKFNLTPILEEA